MFDWLFGRKPLSFKDVFVSEEGRYSIGFEQTRRKYYLSIPVSNALVDYEEYYKISKSDFEKFRAFPDAARHFADRCRKRKMDHRLMIKPGRDRGVAS